MISDEIIILGSGTSLKNHTSDVKEKLNGKFSIGCNINYEIFDTTVQIFKDPKFYRNYKNKVDTLPLVITDTEKNKKDVHPNIIRIPHSVKAFYGYDSIKYGAWCNTYTGIYSLSIAIALLKGQGTIYLLGHDFCKSNKQINGKAETHFFQDSGMEYDGYGKCKSFSDENVNKWFTCFLDTSKNNCKIYNVVDQPDSKIHQFEKISYDEFFKLLSHNTYNQDILRQKTRDFIKIQLTK